MLNYVNKIESFSKHSNLATVFKTGLYHNVLFICLCIITKNKNIQNTRYFLLFYSNTTTTTGNYLQNDSNIKLLNKLF